MKRNVIKLHKGLVKIEKGLLVKSEQTDKEKKLANRLLSESLGLGFSIALPIVGGAIIGASLDKIFHTAPIVTLVLLFLGLFLSIFKMFRLTQT